MEYENSRLLTSLLCSTLFVGGIAFFSWYFSPQFPIKQEKIVVKEKEPPKLVNKYKDELAILLDEKLDELDDETLKAKLSNFSVSEDCGPIYGLVIMKYNIDEKWFDYHAHSSTIPNDVLTMVARKYTLVSRCPQIFVDEIIDHKILIPETKTTDVYVKLKKSKPKEQDIIVEDDKKYRVIKEYRKNHFKYCGKLEDDEDSSASAPAPAFAFAFASALLEADEADKSEEAKVETVAPKNTAMTYAQFKAQQQLINKPTYIL